MALLSRIKRLIRQKQRRYNAARHSDTGLKLGGRTVASGELKLTRGPFLERPGNLSGPKSNS